MRDGLLFLGTAGDVAVYGKQQRASGGMILTYEGNQFHINPGPGSLIKYKENDIHVRETNAVFLTDNEIINANDVNAVIEAMTLNGLDKKGILIMPKTENPYVTNKHKMLVEKYIEVDPTMRLAINEIEIKPTPSTKEHANGYIFYTQKYSLGITGSTAYSEDLAKAFKDVHVLIINCKNTSEIEEENELNLEDVKKLVAKTKPDTAILTFFGQKMLQTDLLDEARNVQKETGVETMAANDGLFLDIADHAKSQRQQSLRSFVK